MITLLGALSTGFTTRIAENTAIAPDVRDQVVSVASSEGVGLIAATDAEEILVEAGVPPSDAALIADDYAAAQLEALKLALFGVAVIALFAFIAAKRLPQREVLPADAATEPGPSTAEAPSPLAVG